MAADSLGSKITSGPSDCLEDAAKSDNDVPPAGLTDMESTRGFIIRPKELMINDTQRNPLSIEDCQT